MTAAMIPAQYQAVINVALSQDLPEFYTEGGCGVLAALMAEAAAIYGYGGELNLIMRTETGACHPCVSHITFIPDDAALDLDIHGPDAEDGWIEFLCDDARENDEDPADIDLHNESIRIEFGDDIQTVLEELTEEQDLTVNVDWVQENYPKLKSMLIQSIAALPA